MSETENPKSSDVPPEKSPPASSTTSASTSSPTISRARRWRSRLTWLIGITIVVVAIFRIALILILPPVLRSVAGRYGLTCSYERMELYLVDGDVGLWQVTLAPKEGGEPLLRSEYCRADISTYNLLKGRLVARRIEADGVDLNIERSADGEIPLLTRLDAILSAPPSKTTADTKSGPVEIDLTSPLRIDAFRLHHVKAHLRDHAVSPALDTTLELDVRLTDLASNERPTRFLLDITAAPVLDTLRIEGEGTARGKDLDATMSVLLRGLHPREAAGYLQPLGIRPIARDITMRMDAKVKTSAVAPPNPAKEGEKGAPLRGTLTLDKISVTVDGEEALATDHLIVDADSISPDFASIVRVAIDGARCNASRSKTGIAVAGLELSGQPVSRKSSASAAPVATTRPAMALIPFKLAEFSVKNAGATLHDSAVAPASTLAFVLDEFTMKNIVSDPKHPDESVTIAGAFGAPGVIKTIRLDGTAVPFAARKTFAIKVKADDINPEALRPYLDAVGLESELKSGSFTCDLNATAQATSDGTFSADARLDGIRFSDQKELFGLASANIAGLSVDPALSRVRVQSIEVSGPSFSARRDASGSIAALGFRTKAGGALLALRPTSPASPSESTPPMMSPLKLPAIEIGRLVWKDVRVEFADSMTTPVTSLAIADAGVELTGLKIDPDPEASSPAEPGKLHAWLRAPGVADDIAVNGTIVPQPSGPAIEVDVVGTGITGSKVATYLKPFAVEPIVKNGSLKMHVKLAMTSGKEVLGASVTVENLKWADGARELVGLDSLRVSGAELRSGELTIGEIALDRPRATAAREKDGTLVVAGVRQIINTTRQAVAVVAASGTRPAAAPPSNVLIVKKLRVKDGSLRWDDAAVQPAVGIAGSASVELDDLVLGKSAAPARLKLNAKADGSLDDLTVVGTVSVAPKVQEAHLDVTAIGLRAGALAAYVPDGVRVSLKDGRARTKIDVAIAENPRGGHNAKLDVANVNFQDGANGPALLKLDAFKVLVSRFDLAGQTIAVDELSLAGFETDVTKSADGATHLAGITLAPKTGKGQTASTTTQPAVAVAATAPLADVNQLIAQSRQKLPLVTLSKLDLNVRRVKITDASRPQASPLTLAEVRVHNAKPIELLGDDPAGRAPVELEINGRLDPVAKSFRLTSQLAPFAPQPTVQLDLAAAGVRGEGIVALLPELKDHLDGKPLADGRFAAHLEAQAKFDRRRPTDFDLSDGVDIDFLLKNVAFRNGEGGPTLAGVEEVHSEGIHVEPKTGAVQVRSLEISKPIAHAFKDKDGVHVLGCLIRLPATQPSPPSAAEASVAKVEDTTITPQAASPPSSRPSAEIRIDKLLISGLDVRVEDRSVDPPLIVPLNGLDVEVRDLSNLAPYEDRPVRFSAMVTAGKVTVPERRATDSDDATEERELFSQIVASGKVGLFPHLNGWAKTSVSGLDLVALRGEAKQQGVTLGGGVFDSTTDVRFKDNGSLDSRSKFVLTDLSVSEQPDGPLQRGLRMPAPLDVVLLAIQDPSGGITIPLDVPIREGELSTGAVAGSAVGAMASVFATAVASAPIKVGGAVTSLVGIVPGKDQNAAPEQPTTITFNPGDTSLSMDDVRAIDGLLARLRDNEKLELTLRHELGCGDVSRMAVRANPSPEDCTAIAYQLRRQKMDLLTQRADSAGEARGVLASRVVGENDPVLTRLRAIDRELAQTEDALDRVYELLRPGAERQAGRRTRAACIEFGQQRLDAVKSVLMTGGLPALAERVHVTRAQFNEAEGDEGGKITITVTGKKK